MMILEAYKHKQINVLQFQEGFFSNNQKDLNIFYLFFEAMEDNIEAGWWIFLEAMASFLWSFFSLLAWAKPKKHNLDDLIIKVQQ